MLRTCLILLLGLVSVPAAAGLRATYGGSLQAPMVVEIADNGDVAADLGGGRRLLIISGRAYVVEERLTGPVVDRLEDLAALSVTVDAEGLTAAAVAERRGTAEIGGRTGQAWFLRGATGRASAQPIAVISSAPALAPLAAVMRRVFAAQATVIALEAHFPLRSR